MNEDARREGRSATDRVAWVGDGDLAERVEAAGSVAAVPVDEPSDLHDAADVAACVVVGSVPPAFESALAAAPAPVVVWTDADPTEVADVADDFVRRDGGADALLDRLAWHGAAGRSRDRRKVEQLHDIATELLGCREEDTVYDIVVDAAERVLAFDICSVDAVEDGRLVPKAVSEGMADDGYEGAPVEEGGLAGEAHRTGDSSIVDDIRDSAAADPATDEYRSVLTVPIGETAVFQAGSTAVGAFDETDRELAELLAAHAEGTLHRIRSEAAVRKRRETIERLHDIVARMVACESPADVYDLLVEAAEEVLEFSVCVVIADDPAAEQLVVQARSDADLAPPVGDVFQYEEGVAGRTFRTGEAMRIDDVPASETAAPHSERYRSAVSAPMGDAGVLQAISTVPSAFSEHDLEMLELLASQAGTVLTRLRAESRLRTERDRLRALFDHVPDPAVSFVVEDEPLVRDVNPAFEETFGYDGEAAVGRNIDDLVVPEDHHDGAVELNRRFRAGDAFQREVQRETADGRRRDFLIHVVPTERSTDNAAGYAIYTDITDRKRRERRLNSLNRTTRELLGATDADAVSEIAVAAARDILELPVTGVFRREGDRLVLAAASADAWAVFDGPPPVFGPDHDVWTAFESGEPQVLRDVDTATLVDGAAVEAVMVFPLGEYGVVVSGGSGADAFDEGTRDLAGVLAANVEAALARAERERHLRERERELQRQNDRLEEFASVVSHDLRTPLSVARGHLDLAMEDRDDERLRKVADAHERMDALIDDLLTLAREGRVVGDTEPVDVGEAADAAWSAVGTPDARLSVADPVRVEADRDRLVQLLENLFRNSIEHADDGSEQAADPVAVEVGALDEDAHADGFYVADDGPGIPEDDRDRVFERGYTTAEDGTGFGLAIVREIVRAHGWTVGVTESEAGGARFEIRTR